jgi:hypothetical protein
VPRAIIVRRSDRWYFLDCPFNDALDDYGDKYTVYELQSFHVNLADEPDWNAFPSIGTVIGTIPITCVHFDETRRQFIADNVFELLE